MQELYRRYRERTQEESRPGIDEVAQALEALGFEVEFYDLGPKFDGSNRRGCTFTKGDVIVQMTATVDPYAELDDQDEPKAGPFDHIIETLTDLWDDLV